MKCERLPAVDMSTPLSAPITKMLRSLSRLEELLPCGGLSREGEVLEEMDGMISPEFEPYFSGNAALHLSSVCQRCGRCCREERTVAVSIDDCRRIARYIGLSLKRFMADYTSPHELKGDMIGNARMLRKAKDAACPFYSSEIPGCSIHPVKPQVCKAAFYLSKMNMLLCQENGEFCAVVQCPSDGELRGRIRDLCAGMKEEPGIEDALRQMFLSPGPQVRLFLLLLRLKGMEVYFGQEKAAWMARKLGLKRIPTDDELRPAAFLYAAVLLGPSLACGSP